MKYIDTHVHIGEYHKIKEILQNSPFKKQYRLYSAIDAEVIKFAESYLGQCEAFLVMPIVLKELNIEVENDYVLEFCEQKAKAIPMLLVGDSLKKYSENGIRFLKEHFLYHNSTEWEKRKKSYEYLNSIKGFLLIHSFDIERIEYIRNLRDKFPDMHIIIAHMGRNVWENYEFTISIINAFKLDLGILFDISTITNVEIIRYAIKTIGSKRLLFASDFPYEFKIGMNVQTFAQKINCLDISEEEKENIFYKNAINIMHGET